MALKINMTGLEGKKLLVAPLDWGLGHATRCIPVIKAFQQSGGEIWLAGEGQQEVLLKTEFPELPFLPLKGYRVKLTGKNTTAGLLLQIPSILRSIWAEHKWLDEQVKEKGFDVVLSDNRYGLYTKHAHCIFMTHQLTIKSPLGKWAEQFLQSLNYSYINRFNECWVPDGENKHSLAGELSHPKKFPAIPVRYIGTLSRFEQRPGAPIIDHLLIILSGPEPQRSRFESMILDQLSAYRGTATLVRGLPSATDVIPSTDRISIVNHLPSSRLNEEMGKASWIISRSGYTTIMDIVTLNKKSLLVPTPGQSEQEYLARYLHKKKIIYTVSQNNFSLEENLAALRVFDFSLPARPENYSTMALG